MLGDGDEVDELSLVEDSYASASESTLMTIVETFQQQDSRQIQESCADTKQIMSLSSDSDYQLNLSLDSLKDKPIFVSYIH
jgi:hypothetical protein